MTRREETGQGRVRAGLPLDLPPRAPDSVRGAPRPRSRRGSHTGRLRPPPRAMGRRRGLRASGGLGSQGRCARCDTSREPRTRGARHGPGRHPDIGRPVAGPRPGPGCWRAATAAASAAMRIDELLRAGLAGCLGRPGPGPRRPVPDAGRGSAANPAPLGTGRYAIPFIGAADDTPWGEVEVPAGWGQDRLLLTTGPDLDWPLTAPTPPPPSSPSSPTWTKACTSPSRGEPGARAHAGPQPTTQRGLTTQSP